MGLERVADDPEPSSDARHIRRCSRCGTFYRYHATHDYLVDGSEDAEGLTRLTPTEARRFYDEKTYAELLAAARERLRHPNRATRCYAARSVAADLLGRGEYGALAELLSGSDDESVRAVLMLLYRISEEAPPPPGLTDLVGALLAAGQRGDAHLTAVARSLLERAARAGEPIRKTAARGWLWRCPRRRLPPP